MELINMVNEYQIRHPKNKEEVKEMKAINEKCLPENYPLAIWIQLTSSYPDLALVLYHTGTRKVVGYTMGQVTETNMCNLFSFAILPEHRKKGYGKRLLMNFIGRGLKRGFPFCLHVRESNTVVDLYKKVGFVVTRTDEKYYDNEENALFMTFLPNQN